MFQILSADNGVDGVSSYSRPPGRRGVIEKSASTHSDSSGFADLDLESAGEPVHSNLDLQQVGTQQAHDVRMTSDRR